MQNDPMILFLYACYGAILLSAFSVTYAVYTDKSHRI